MVYQERTKDLVEQYTSLSLAIDKLIEGQEKDWGCFQVKKEDNFYSLYLPGLPSFKLYQNPKSVIYRGYWRRSHDLPKATDTKSFPPDLWIKKKQKKVTITKGTSSNKVEKKSLKFVNQISFSNVKKTPKKAVNIVKKQRIFEIVYRYHYPAVELRMISQLVAASLKEKIIATIVDVPEDEIFPLVLIGNPE